MKNIFSALHTLALALQRDLLKLQLKRVLTLSATDAQVRVTTK